jgi:hypothetical protein
MHFIGWMTVSICLALAGVCLFIWIDDYRDARRERAPVHKLFGEE